MLKYLGVVFMSDGKQNKGIEVNMVLRELYHTLVMKQDRSTIAKLFVFKSVFSLILTYDDHEC